MPKKISKYRIREISLVDKPAQEPARVALVKRRSSGKPQGMEENKMPEGENANVELAKQLATSQAEVTKRDEQIKALEKSVKDLQEAAAKAEAPKPQVIYKMEGVGEVTTESDPVTQALAKRLQEAEFAKQAAEKAPNVDKELAVSLLKAGQAEALETLEKQQKELKKSGSTLRGDGTVDDNDDGSFKPPSEEEIQAVMKTHGFAKRMDAVRLLARPQAIN